MAGTVAHTVRYAEPDYWNGRLSSKDTACEQAMFVSSLVSSVRQPVCSQQSGCCLKLRQQPRDTLTPCLHRFPTQMHKAMSCLLAVAAPCCCGVVYCAQHVISGSPHCLSGSLGTQHYGASYVPTSQRRSQCCTSAVEPPTCRRAWLDQATRSST